MKQHHRYRKARITLSEGGISNQDYGRISALMEQLTGRHALIPIERILRTQQQSILLLARNQDLRETGGNPRGLIVGLAILTRGEKLTASFGTIEDVVVDETHRRKGIGKTLIARLLERAKDLGMSYVELTSQTGRQEANQLYLSLGFEFRDTNVLRRKI